MNFKILLLLLFPLFSQSKELKKEARLIKTETKFAGKANSDYDRVVYFYYDKLGKPSNWITKSNRGESKRTYVYKNNKPFQLIYEDSSTAFNSLYEFEYDNNDRLVRVVLTRTSNNNLASEQATYGNWETELVYNGNSIRTTSTSYSNGDTLFIVDDIHLDSESHFLYKEHIRGYANYQYPKKKYDNYKNPMISAHPKELHNYLECTPTNILEVSEEELVYKYQYNKYGYPKTVEKYKSGKLVSTTIYTYKN